MAQPPLPPPWHNFDCGCRIERFGNGWKYVVRCAEHHGPVVSAPRPAFLLPQSSNSEMFP